MLGRDRGALLLERAGLLVVGGTPALEVEHLDGSVVRCPDPLGRGGRTGLEGVGVEVAEHRPEPLVFLLREREVGRRGGEGGLGSAGGGRGGLDRVRGGVVVLRHRDARVLDRTAHRAGVARLQGGAEFPGEAGDPSSAQVGLRGEGGRRCGSGVRDRSLGLLLGSGCGDAGGQVGPELGDPFDLDPGGLGVGGEGGGGPCGLDDRRALGRAALERVDERRRPCREVLGRTAASAALRRRVAKVRSTATRCRTSDRQSARAVRRPTTSMSASSPAPCRRAVAASVA